MAAEPNAQAGQRSRRDHRQEAEGRSSRCPCDEGRELRRSEDRRIVPLSRICGAFAMTALRDTARAKLNLTLEVLGRRADGYHEVRSLVAFAELGDSLELESGQEFALSIDRPFGYALHGENLVTAAAEAVKAIAPALKIAPFRLTKTLPLASGLGGGSADAAAALRLLAR